MTEPGLKKGALFIQCAALFLLVLIAAACSRASSEAARNFPAASPDSDLFEDTNIVQISIEIPRKSVRVLEGYRWHPGWQEERPQVQVTVREGPRVYTNVALHLKGAAGSFRPLNDRPALTLNFDKFAKGQRFHGLQKLSLNNSVQDSTFLSEKICRELFHAAGVPVPRSDFAIVTLNGRALGLYVLVEGYNKQFLRRYFKNVGGNLYDGGFCQDITAQLEVNSGDDENDRSDLGRLINAAIKARQEGDLAGLAEVLDVDRFASMLAMEVIQCHWDGYGMKPNNYRVFNNRDARRMVFMPHGLDQVFGMGDRSNIDVPVIPRMAGLVAHALVNTRDGRELYLRRFGELRTNVFIVEAVTNRVRALERRIRPALATFGPIDLSFHEQQVNRLCENIAARAVNIDDQLNAPPPPVLAFGPDGTVKLSGWRPRAGSGSFRSLKTADGNDLLVIAARGSSAASWRTRMVLPEGRYRFEGLARTAGVSRTGQSGATLRISGMQNLPVLNGDTDWSPLSFPFEVHEFEQEVELVCELKGSRGEARFDAASLRVRRVN